MASKALFSWKPFSPKGLKVMTWWRPDSPHSHKMIICMEGAVRSGKTATGSFSFTMWAMSQFDDEEFALCGKTIGTARRNIVRHLKRMLAARGAKVEDHRNATEGNYLSVEWLGNKNIFWIFGGKDERSQDLIQGATLAGIFYDEAILMPISFLNQGMARTSVDGAKIWISLNPESPDHPFYSDWLDANFNENDMLYLHFTMDDNPALSDDTKDRYRRMWPEGSVWYNRYILGQRTSAEGRIYDFFRPEVGAGYVVDKLPEQFTRWIVSIDYGSTDPFAAILWGLGRSPEDNQNTWYIVREFYWDSKEKKRQKSPTEYIQALAELCKWNGREVYPQIYCDPAEAAFIIECRKAKKYPTVRRARKAQNAVKDGLINGATMFSEGYVKIFYTCDNLIKYINNYRWDENKAVETPLHIGSHMPDAYRYGAMEAIRNMR